MGSYPSGIAGCSAIFPFQASEKGSVTQGPPCIIVVGNAGMLPLNVSALFSAPVHWDGLD